MTRLYQLANCSPSRSDFMKQTDIQKQQTDTIFIQQQYMLFSSLSEKMIRKGMTSTDPRIKFSAMLVAGDKQLPLRNEMLKILTDENPLVRQAARRALILQSAVQMDPNWKKSKSPKFVDFGPMPCCTEKEAKASRELWEAWWEDQTPTLSQPVEKKK